MAEKKESFFWTSYSDLMTSLFFIMLTLFVLVIVLLSKQLQITEEQKTATEEQLTKIKKIMSSTKELEKSRYYIYKPEYEKYVLDVYCHFEKSKYALHDLNANITELFNAGIEIRDFINRNSTTKYLLIIEGQASRNSYSQSKFNYELSFKRALTLMEFWKDYCQIDFGTNCEIQIAGSGDGRYNFGYTDGEQTAHFRELDNTLMRERGYNEEKNQRFVIHIIPKNIMLDE